MCKVRKEPLSERDGNFDKFGYEVEQLRKLSGRNLSLKEMETLATISLPSPYILHSSGRNLSLKEMETLGVQQVASVFQKSCQEGTSL